MRFRNSVSTFYHHSPIQLLTLCDHNPDLVQYLEFQEELCPTTNKYHLQGYVEFKGQFSKKRIQDAFNDKTLHLEKRKGTQAQAIEYCSVKVYKGKDKGKVNDLVFTWGEPKEQGKRKGIAKIRELAKQGYTYRKIVDEIEDDSINFQSIRCAQLLTGLYMEPRRFKPSVIWIYGETGKGKTRVVYDLFDDVFSCMNGKWFDGYEGNQVCLIDDYRKDFMTFNRLLKFIGQYPFRIEYKGGTMQMISPVMVFTAPYPPDGEEMWEHREDLKQLMRRIDKVFEIVNDCAELILYINNINATTTKKRPFQPTSEDVIQQES